MDNIKSNPDLERATMNVEQARECLGYAHRSTVYLRLESGDLEGYRVGRQRGIRIYRDSVEAFKRREIGDPARPTMDVEQAREFLGYRHRSTIYRLLSQADLEGCRKDRRGGVRVFRDSVEAFKCRIMDEGY